VTSIAPRETDAPRVDRRRDGFRHRVVSGIGRRVRHQPWVWGTLLGLVALVVVAGGVYIWWLGGGLLHVSDTVQGRAKVAQKQLRAFEVSVKAGDEKAAGRHLTRAKVAVRQAEDSVDAPQVRIAKFLPYTRSTVADLDHLLTAANVMIDSADSALTVYSNFSGDSSKVFQNGRFNIDALVSARAAVVKLVSALDTAESNLKKVHGNGPKGHDALDAKRTALRQIAALRSQVAPLAPLVEALPSAVGANGTKRYLVAVMNPAEMRASGGAPLSVAFVVFKNGKYSVPLKGTTSSITRGSPAGLLGDNPRLVWNRVKGDPFQPPLGRKQRFVNATFNPDFRVSGEQLMRGTQRFFGMKTDGVIALDVVALSKLLAVTGPIPSEFGTLTAANLADELLVKAYEQQGTDIIGRQQRNDQLMSTMLSRLTQGGGIRAKAQALLSAAPARHLQVYFRDERLQRLAVTQGVAGAVPTPKTGNLTAVYTQNVNGSKVDVFQRRTVAEVVHLRKDGSGVVDRTVQIQNATPPFAGAGPDPKFGYVTRWATNLVTNLMPPGAKVTRQPQLTKLPTTAKTGRDQEGRTYAQAAVETPPGETSELSWSYTLPRAMARQADGSWLMTDAVVPQNTLNGFVLRSTVIAPDGWTVSAPDSTQSWLLNGGTAFLEIAVGQPITLQVRVAPQ
jgi:hypothetical protein